ncbi:CMRF35-like molecule 1 [Acanthochromis polyacanthus]|uniref:CMRF35-like molecule 1 n=1 Tax=Acanthochromis polyacanthus TaxID=80966 RepID=UPI0022347FA6|nr:CMRF35-like molecule 1 [Acanthochromis polyacanthus]
MPLLRALNPVSWLLERGRTLSTSSSSFSTRMPYLAGNAPHWITGLIFILTTVIVLLIHTRRMMKKKTDVHTTQRHRRALIIVETTTLNIKGRIGKNVTVHCENWNVWTYVEDNAKYICNSPCKEDKDIFMKAEYGQTKKKNRIELTNAGYSLYVTFFNLKMSDSRKFYCGVERNGPDAYIEVNLKVTDDFKSSTVPTTNLEMMTGLSDSYTALDTTPIASASQGSGSVLYLTIGVIVILTTLIVLWRLVRTVRRKLNIVSGAGSPQEDAQVNVDPDGVYQLLHPSMEDRSQVYSTLMLTKRSAASDEVYETLPPSTRDLDHIYSTLEPTMTNADL